MSRRNYLAVFILPTPEKEHAQIVNVLKDGSGGDYKAVFFGGKQCVGYLFSSEHNPWDIGFGRVLLNNDSLLIIEVGERFTHQNLRVAENWLASHQTQGRK